MPPGERAMSPGEQAMASGEQAMASSGRGAPPVERVVPPIEVESYRRLRELVDLGGLPRLSRAVAERVVYASADLGYVDDLVLDEAALARGLEALRAGAAVVTDTRMVAAGVAARSVRCGLDEPDVAAVAAGQGLTRSAAGILLAAAGCGPGAVYVIGNAPTALRALLGADVAPALVIGLPVGLVDAAESKAALRASGLPALTNRSAKGGSAVAAAALNALLYSDARDRLRDHAHDGDETQRQGRGQGRGQGARP
jgi:precorrin-8X/cobalt-precorrin-8 methylmutase